MMNSELRTVVEENRKEILASLEEEMEHTRLSSSNIDINDTSL